MMTNDNSDERQRCRKKRATVRRGLTFVSSNNCFIFLVLSWIGLPKTKVVRILVHSWTSMYHLFCAISGGSTVLQSTTLVPSYMFQYCYLDQFVSISSGFLISNN
ncbi:unnamed protein product, partial [Musa textilis]